MVFVGSLVLSLSAVTKKGMYVGVPLVMLAPLGFMLPLMVRGLGFQHFYLFGGIQENMRIVLGGMLNVDVGLFYSFGEEGGANINPLLSLTVLLVVMGLALLNLFYQLARMEVDE